MQAKRIHCTPHTPKASKTIQKPTRNFRKADFLTALPTDLQSLVLHHLPSTALSLLPKVHPTWSSLFHSPALQLHFRQYLRVNYQLDRKRSSCSWGQLYLQLRRESCHLCPSKNIQPFVYAASACLGALEELVALFPVCNHCFETCDACAFLPVEEVDIADITTLPSSGNVDAFQHAQSLNADGRRVHSGFLYSDIPRKRDARKICFVYVDG